MSSTGVVAIFIPIVLRIAQNTGTAPSRLMMPLSVAALISGMMTLVATAPNLVVDSELRRSGAEGFEFFSFTPFGVPILVLGIALHAVRAPLARGRGRAGGGRPGRPSLRDWIERVRARRPRAAACASQTRSPLAGRTLEELRAARQHRVRICWRSSARRGSRPTSSSAPATTARSQAATCCWSTCSSPDTDVEALRARAWRWSCCRSSGAYFADRAQEVGMAR